MMGPTVAHINHDHLRYNIGLIRKAVGNRKIMAVVKADAYGHGDVEIARSALSEGCEYLAVAFMEEGVRLRKSGIKAPILVFGAQLPELLDTALQYDLECTITDFSQIDYINTMPADTQRLKIHLKFDSGMHRVGFHVNDVKAVIDRITNSDHFDLKGVYSHFATADDQDQSYALRQLELFTSISKQIIASVVQKPLIHMANSAAIMTLPESYFDMVRPGVMLYGCSPSPEFDLKWPLKEVMELHSRLALIKHIKRGDDVSYGRRFTAKDDGDIGIIPVGYADGYRRGLTNNADVLIAGKRFKQIGTVCMDMIMVWLGNNHGLTQGDEVILFGQDNHQQISINDVARSLNTITYEITCGISKRVPRVHHSV